MAVECRACKRNFNELKCDFEEREKVLDFVLAHRLIPTTSVCPNCCRVVELNTKMMQFRCDKSKKVTKSKRTEVVRCRYHRSAMIGTFFEKSHIPLEKILLMSYMFLASHKNLSHESHEFDEDEEIPKHNLLYVQQQLNLAQTTVVIWFNFYREILVYSCVGHSQRLGGPGQIVELYEGKFRKKYTTTKGKWLIGGVQRDIKRVFLVAADDCEEDTLVETIKQYVLPDTTIITDSRSSFKTLGNHGYTQKKLDKTDNYVDPDTGQYTSDFKKMWKNVKGRDKGLRRAQYSETYLAQLLFKKMYTKQSERFHNFLLLAGQFCSPQISKNLEKYEEWTRLLNMEELIVADTSMKPSALKKAYNSIGNGTESSLATASPRAKSPRNAKTTSKKQSANTKPSALREIDDSIEDDIESLQATNPPWAKRPRKFNLSSEKLPPKSTSFRQRKKAASVAGRKRKSEAPLDEHLLNVTSFRQRKRATSAAGRKRKSEAPLDEHLINVTSFRQRKRAASVVGHKRKSEAPLDEHLLNVTTFRPRDTATTKADEIKSEVPTDDHLPNTTTFRPRETLMAKLERSEAPLEEHLPNATRFELKEAEDIKQEEPEIKEEVVDECWEKYLAVVEEMLEDEIKEEKVENEIKDEKFEVTTEEVKEEPMEATALSAEEYEVTHNREPMEETCAVKDESGAPEEPVGIAEMGRTTVTKTTCHESYQDRAENVGVNQTVLPHNIQRKQHSYTLQKRSLPDSARKKQLRAFILQRRSSQPLPKVRSAFDEQVEFKKCLGTKVIDSGLACRVEKKQCIEYPLPNPTFPLLSMAVPVFTPEQENQLEECFRKADKWFRGLKNRDARRLVYDFAVRYNIKRYPSWDIYRVADRKWLMEFLKRHPSISLRKSRSRRSLKIDINRILDSLPKLINVTVTTQENSKNCNVSDSHKEDSHKSSGSQEFKSDSCNSVSSTQNTLPRHINVTITVKDNSEKCCIIHPPNQDSHKSCGSQEVKSDSSSFVFNTDDIKHIRKTLPNVISVRTTTQENSEKFNESHSHQEDSHRLSGSQKLKSDSNSFVLSTDYIKHIQKTLPNVISVRTTTQENSEKKFNESHSHKEDSHRLSGSQDLKGDSCNSAFSADTANHFQNTVPKLLSVTVTTRDTAKKCCVNHSHKEKSHRLFRSQEFKSDICTDNINCIQNEVPKPISVTITTKDNLKKCSVNHLHKEDPHKFSRSQELKSDGWYFAQDKVYQITNYKKNVSCAEHPSDIQENKKQNENVLNIPVCLKEGNESNDNQCEVNGKTAVMMKAGNAARDNVSQIITPRSDACHVRHEWLFDTTPETEKKGDLLFNVPVSGVDRESFNDTQSNVCARETVFVDVEEFKEEEDIKEEDMFVRNSDPICL